MSVCFFAWCDACSAIFSVGKKKVFNVMLANAEDIKMVAKVGKDESLPFKGEICRFAVNCGFLNTFRTERVLKNKKCET